MGRKRSRVKAEDIISEEVDRWLLARTKENIVYTFRSELKKVDLVKRVPFSHHRNKNLLGLGIIDKCPNGFSSGGYCLTEYSRLVIADIERKS